MTKDLTEEQKAELCLKTELKTDADAFSGLLEVAIGRIGWYYADVVPCETKKDVFLLNALYVSAPSTFTGIAKDQKVTVLQLIDFLKWIYEKNYPAGYPKAEIHIDLVEKLGQMRKDFDLWLDSQ